jgi:hypothetical protein
MIIEGAKKQMLYHLSTKENELSNYCSKYVGEYKKTEFVRHQKKKNYKYSEN